MRHRRKAREAGDLFAPQCADPGAFYQDRCSRELADAGDGVQDIEGTRAGLAEASRDFGLDL